MTTNTAGVEKKKPVCPTCGYSGLDLVRIRSCATNKMHCQHCVPSSLGEAATSMIDKLAGHQDAGTLADYPIEQRLADLHGRKPETIQ